MGKSGIRVAYLSYDGLTDPLGQSQILPYILGLEANGFEFTVISFEKSIPFEKEKINIEKIIAGRKIVWRPLRYHKQPLVLSTLFDIDQLNNEFFSEQRKKPFAIVHCRSYITALVGLRAKKKLGIKFIFDMRGFWADERVEGGLWNLKNPIFQIIYNFFKRKEKTFLKLADHTISLTQNAKREIESWNLPSAPITVIPTCVDVDLFSSDRTIESDKSLLRNKLGIRSDEFVMLYLGSWGTWYLTDEMINTFRVLRKLIRGSCFLIVSQDKVKFDQEEFGDSIIVTHASRHEVPLYISIASMSIFFIKPSFSKKASSATKLGELLSMGKCVLTNSGWGDSAEMPQVAIVKDFTESELKNGLVRVIEKMDAGEKANIDHLTLTSGVGSYHLVYNSLF